MESQKGREYHAQAEKAREEGQFLEALAWIDKTLIAYSDDKDMLGYTEALASRSITYRNYATLHNKPEYLTLAKHEMMGAVAIARKSNMPQALALPLYNLATQQEVLGELSEAVVTYKEAIKYMQTHPPQRHNRPSVLANMRVHMTTCEYKMGDETARERAEQSLQELIDAQEPDMYTRDVWISGGYMRMADMLRDDDLTLAKGYLEKAKQVIDGNPQLKVRKQQWEKLAERFMSS
jgi:hypothetical protein